MNKTQFLERMKRLGACNGATEYVRNHASDDAQVIWRGCSNPDWLMWYAFRVAPGFGKRFAFKAADRARLFAASALDAKHPEIAAKLRALAPIVDKETALAAKDTAGVAANAVNAAADAAAVNAVNAAANAAAVYYAANAAYYAACYAADAAAYAASAANDAAASFAADAAGAYAYSASAERKLQIKRLHRWQVR